MAEKAATATKGAAAPSAPKESKNAKFRRIAPRKLSNALKAIGGVAGVATKAYDYSQEEASAMVKHLEEAVMKVHTLLKANIEPKSAAATTNFDPFAGIPPKA